MLHIVNHRIHYKCFTKKLLFQITIILMHDARIDIHAHGFWEHQRSAFFDVRVCHPNAKSYRDIKPQQVYRVHEKEKKRQYSS